MRYKHLLRLAVGTLITCILLAFGAAAVARNNQWAEGHILVKPRAHVSSRTVFRNAWPFWRPKRG